MANELAIVKKDVVDVVTGKIGEFINKGELNLPSNYSISNAMKSAWLKLQTTVDRNKKPVLTSCTKDSIANCLLSMAVQGLNPDKTQCYFIAYGNQLTLHRSYFGTMAVAKRVDTTIDDIFADVVYEDDTFEYKKVRGKNVISNHTQKLSNIDKSKIVAAYCTIVHKDDTEETTIMTFDEIKWAWKQSRNPNVDDKGNLSNAQFKFTAEMSKKTVINRACKKVINNSDDSSLLIQYTKEQDLIVTNEQAKEDVEQNTSKGEIIDTEVEFSEVKEENHVEENHTVNVTTGEVMEDDVPSNDPY